MSLLEDIRDSVFRKRTSSTPNIDKVNADMEAMLDKLREDGAMFLEANKLAPLNLLAVPAALRPDQILKIGSDGMFTGPHGSNGPFGEWGIRMKVALDCLPFMLATEAWQVMTMEERVAKCYELADEFAKQKRKQPS